jgi:hypothetical protein
MGYRGHSIRIVKYFEAVSASCPNPHLLNVSGNKELGRNRPLQRDCNLSCNLPHNSKRSELSDGEGRIALRFRGFRRACAMDLKRLPCVTSLQEFRHGT